MKKSKKIKSKKDIVSDIQLVTDATRRRALVKDIIFPYLLKMKEEVGYSKIFLQSFSSIIDGIFNETAKKITIGDITPALIDKLHTIFKVSDEKQKQEFDKYMGLIEKIQDVSIQDVAYATELPRYMDGFFAKETDKRPISDVDIVAILG